MPSGEAADSSRGAIYTHDVCSFTTITSAVRFPDASLFGSRPIKNPFNFSTFFFSFDGFESRCNGRSVSSLQDVSFNSTAI